MKYYEELINTVLDEIANTIKLLKSGRCVNAYAMYLDFKGDVSKLNSRDYSAACDLFWRGVEDAGFELYSQNDLQRHAGFQLAF